MYKNGELEEVMSRFEASLSKMPVYVGGTVERADKVQIDTDDGRIAKRYVNDNYYNNGNVNQMFLLYLWGYAFGKSSTIGGE